MLEPGSEYSIPIFISSAVYNLVDLRAELALYLRGIGYKPVLSSENGFPHEVPTLAPWESCLPALEQCYVVVLIVDGRYGQRLKWENYASVLGEESISPTHAEYRYAHKLNKRLLVFVRKTVETYYQSYREVMRAPTEDERTSKAQALKAVLPDHLDFGSLEFFQEVKTTKPIPWILSFDDVTEIKTEIQKQLLNELARLFMSRERRLGDVVHKLARSLDDLAVDERKRVLHTMGGDDLVTLVEHQTTELASVRGQMAGQRQELERLQGIEGRDGTRQKQLAEALERVQEKERRIQHLENERASALTGSYTLSDFTPGASTQWLTTNVSPFSMAGPSWQYGATLTTPLAPACDTCGVLDKVRRCALCHRNLCAKCFDRRADAIAVTTRSPLEMSCAECARYVAPPPLPKE